MFFFQILVTFLVFIAATAEETEPITSKNTPAEELCRCTVTYLCDRENIVVGAKPYGRECQPRGNTVCCKSPKPLYTAPLPTSDTGETIFDSRCYCVPTYLCHESATLITDPIVPCSAPFVCCPKAKTAQL